jgi:alpha-ketoglutarate-dependent 2,4-dichlorophenoxyacetate dioxygenase
MAITVCPVTQSFAAEIGDVDLSVPLAPDDLAAIKNAFAAYAVLIFPEQHLSQDQHLDFARNFGPLETTIAVFRKDNKLRLPPQLSDVSNLSPDNEVWGADTRQRMFQMGNRLWHTDSSFKRLPARASLLYARTIAPVGGHTEFADERAAYDALPDPTRRRLDGLVAEHSIFTSRARLGFTNFSDEERQSMPPVPQVLVRTIPESGQIALPRVARGPRVRPARRGGPRADRGADRACDPAAVRLYPPLAGARPGDLGQPLHHAPRHRVRRPALEARRAARDRERPRQHLRAGGDRGGGGIAGRNGRRAPAPSGAAPPLTNHASSIATMLQHNGSSPAA